MKQNDEAAAKLYRAPLSDFVAERKRLASELKAAGHKDAAAELGKLPRPSVSAWVVNQLWWHEHEAFQDLLEIAARVKAGDRQAGPPHRQALAKLRERAAQMLKGSGNAATETTLRRVVTTLSAVAANGGFAPDPPGMLSADRDPPGFEALGFASAPAPAPSPASEVERERPRENDSRRLAEEAERRRAEEAERRRAEEAEKQRRRAERERLSAQLRDATKRRDAQRNELSRLRAELDRAEQNLEETQALLAELEQKLTDVSP